MYPIFYNTFDPDMILLKLQKCLTTQIIYGQFNGSLLHLILTGSPSFPGGPSGPGGPRGPVICCTVEPSAFWTTEGPETPGGPGGPTKPGSPFCPLGPLYPNPASP